MKSPEELKRTCDVAASDIHIADNGMVFDANGDEITHLRGSADTTEAIIAKCVNAGYRRGYAQARRDTAHELSSLMDTRFGYEV